MPSHANMLEAIAMLRAGHEAVGAPELQIEYIGSSDDAAHLTRLVHGLVNLTELLLAMRRMDTGVSAVTTLDQIAAGARRSFR